MSSTQKSFTHQAAAGLTTTIYLVPLKKLRSVCVCMHVCGGGNNKANCWKPNSCIWTNKPFFPNEERCGCWLSTSSTRQLNVRFHKHPESFETYEISSLWYCLSFWFMNYRIWTYGREERILWLNLGRLLFHFQGLLGILSWWCRGRQRALD